MLARWRILIITILWAVLVVARSAGAKSFVLTKVFEINDPAALVRAPVMNDSGTIVFGIDYDLYAWPGTRGSALYKWTPKDAAPAIVASTSIDPLKADFANHYTEIRTYTLNNIGTIAFTADRWTPPSTESDYERSFVIHDGVQALFISPVSYSPVCITDAPVESVLFLATYPHGCPLVNYCDGVFAVGSPVPLAESCCFLETFAGGGYWFTCNNHGVAAYPTGWFADDRTINAIALADSLITPVLDTSAHYTAFTEPALNNNGTLTVAAWTDNGGQSLIATTLRSAPLVIAGEGASGPSWLFGPWGSFDPWSFPGQSINDKEEIAFTGWPSDTAGVYSVARSDWGRIDPNVSFVVRGRDKLNGSTVLDESVLDSLSDKSLNIHGQIAFRVRLDDGRQIVFLAEPFAKYKQFCHDTNPWCHDFINASYPNPLQCYDNRKRRWGSLCGFGDPLCPPRSTCIDRRETMSQAGCTITALTTAMTLYGDEITPRDMETWLLSEGLLKENTVVVPSFRYHDTRRNVTIQTGARVGGTDFAYTRLVEALRRHEAVLLAVPAINKANKPVTRAIKQCISGDAAGDRCEQGAQCPGGTCSPRLLDGVHYAATDDRHYVLAYGIDPRVDANRDPKPSEIFISDPGKGGQFYSGFSDWRNVKWYLDDNYIDPHSESEKDGVVEDTVDCTLQGYFDKLNSLQEQNAEYTFDVGLWLSKGEFKRNGFSETVQASKASRSNILTTFVSVHPGPAPEPLPILVVESPVEVAVTDPVTARRYVSSVSLQASGDVVVEKSALDVPANLDVDPDEVTYQDEQYPPFLLSLPDGLAGRDLSVEVVGSDDGPFSVSLVPGTNLLKAGPPFAGTISTAERISGFVRVGLRGDGDGDGDIDLADITNFVGKLTGPNASPPGNPSCPAYDDADSDCSFDLRDFAVIQQAFSGPGSTGSCCLGSGTCVERSQPLCMAVGGVYGGPASDCSTAHCALPAEGACCGGDSRCDDKTRRDCEYSGGLYQGDHSTCETTACPAVPRGACCLAMGECSDVLEYECAIVAGTYHGNGSSCEIVRCPMAIYRNEIPVDSRVLFLRGTDNDVVADDMRCSVGGVRPISAYDLGVYSPSSTGTSFSVQASLYDACPFSGGTQIPGTLHTWQDIAGDGMVHVLHADLQNVSAPSVVWMRVYAPFSGGWVIAGAAEAGETDDIFAASRPVAMCNYYFGGDPYAGFYAHLYTPAVTTTVRGAVRLPNGSPAARALISLSYGMTTTSETDGSFFIRATGPDSEPLAIDVRLELEGQLYVASAGPVAPVPGGITDVGALLLRATYDGPLFGKGGIPSLPSPFFLAAGDIDGDGDVDIVAVDYGGGDVWSAFNNGRGLFSSQITGHAGTGALYGTLVDLDGDGDLDLVVQRNLSPTFPVSILLNDGSGMFSSPSSIDALFARPSFAVGDINGDGYPDLIGSSGQNLSLLINSPGAQLQARQVAVPGFSLQFLTLTDFDRDGDLDVVAVGFDPTNYENWFAFVLANNGAGDFAPPAAITPVARPKSIVVSDFNGDSFPDLALYQDSSGNDHVLLFFNDGTATFTHQQLLPIGSSLFPVQIVASDVNLDGRADIVTLSTGSGVEGVVTVLLSKGAGQFAPAVRYPVTEDARMFAANDLNGDGFDDLATIHAGANGLPDTGLLSITLNDGTGSLGEDYGISVPLGTIQMSLTDLDGDGDFDIATANGGFYPWLFSVSTLTNDGNALFSHQALSVENLGQPYSIAAGNFGVGPYKELVVGFDYPSSFWAVFDRNVLGGYAHVADYAGALSWPRVADIDVDGDSDLIAVSNGGIVIIRNDGGGVFAPAIAVGGYATRPAVGDIDGDGLPDIVATQTFDRRVVIIRNEGGGRFAFIGSIAVGPEPRGLDLGDVDRDGDLDIVVGSGMSDTNIAVLRNDEGVFVPTSSVSTTAGIAAVKLADLDGDGFLDLVAAGNHDLYRSTLTVHLNKGNGSFGQGQAYYGGPKPLQIEAADLDGDGDVDLVVLNFDAAVQVLRNRRIR